MEAGALKAWNSARWEVPQTFRIGSDHPLLSAFTAAGSRPAPPRGVGSIQ